MKKPKKKTHSGSDKKKPEGTQEGDKGGGSDEEEEEESEEEESEETESEEGEGKEKEEADGEPDLDAADPKLQAYIKKLRKESAKHRTKAKAANERFTALEGRVKALGGDDEDQTPEERVAALEAHNNAVEFENATLKVALKNGIRDADGIEYFQFLLAKAANDLEEGEELDEEAVDEIAERVTAKFGGSKGSGNSTSVGGKGGNRPDPDKKSALTVGQFVKMSVFEKQDLFKKKPEQYESLLTEAKEKRLLIR